MDDDSTDQDHDDLDSDLDLDLAAVEANLAQARATARRAFAKLQASMLDVVETFTHEAKVATGLIAVLASEHEVTELVTNFDISTERNRLTTSLETYETLRREARVAMWRIMLAEGCSIGEISRIFGVSRQLVSRQLRDVP